MKANDLVVPLRPGLGNAENLPASRALLPPLGDVSVVEAHRNAPVFVNVEAVLGWIGRHEGHFGGDR